MTDVFAPAALPVGPQIAVEVTPNGLIVDLLLTATTAISHHDPAAQDESNTLLFNRNKQLLPGASAGRVTQEEVNNLVAAWLVPAAVADLFQGLSAAEFAAAALVRAFLDCYNLGEGFGLFSGSGRYEMLETRLRAAAVRSPSLRELWGRLCHDLRVPIAAAGDDLKLLRLMALSGALQQATLRALTRDYRQTVMLARLWHQEAKMESSAYAEKAGREAPTHPPVQAQLRPEPEEAGVETSAVVEVPAVSANSLRHQVVRGPGTRHLFAALGLPWGFAGDGTLSLGAEAIFGNGGNIRAGSKQPSDPFGLAWEIRRAHPLLDLLGGVTDSFALGESRLRVAGWLVCRENARALEGTPAADRPAAGVSAFDLLDDVTATRQATERGAGQMIYNFETLCPGTEVLCRLALAPYTDRRTAGALAAALEQFAADGALVGGQGARGFGWMRAERLTWPEELDGARAEYEAYLRENRDALRQGLEEGTLGARSRVVS